MEACLANVCLVSTSRALSLTLRVVLLLPVVCDSFTFIVVFLCLDSAVESSQAYTDIDCLFSGAMLNAHPAYGETPSFKGSMMLAVAENEAQVLELLNNDIYTTSGVWDMENAQIIPVCYQNEGFGFSLLFANLSNGLVQVCCS